MSSSPIELLKTNGLEQYCRIFEKNKIDTADIALSLTDADLSSLGIAALGDRKRILLLFKEKLPLDAENEPAAELSKDYTHEPDKDPKTAADMGIAGGFDNIETDSVSLQTQNDSTSTAGNKTLKTIPQAKKSKTLVRAFVCWFFLGFFGLHQFYLGRKAEGFLRIIFTLFIFIIIPLSEDIPVGEHFLSMYIFFLVFIPWLIDAFTLKKQFANPKVPHLFLPQGRGRKAVMVLAVAVLSVSFTFISAPKILGYFWAESASKAYAEGDYGKALDNYFIAKYFDRKNHEYWAGHAHSCYEAGFYESAIDSFTAALYYVPEWATFLYKGGYYSFRGLAYAGNGDYKRAIADYTEAITMVGQGDMRLSGYYRYRAEAYYALGDYKNAIADYTEVINILNQLEWNHSIPSVYIRRGDIYWDNSQYERAYNDYEEALKIDPFNTDARQRLGR
jgi:Tfp pilus assembly protein PilF